MALSLFPAEIWDKILEFAPNDTLMNTRRVSRFHRESSDRFLFRTITLRNSGASAESVHKVLASQRLKGYVRTLHIDPRPTFLVGYIYNNWHMSLHVPGPIEPVGLPFTGTCA